MSDLGRPGRETCKIMPNGRFCASEPVGLLGGAPDPDQAIQVVQRHVRLWAAADGGADHALAAGIAPQIVYGDMDSISARARAAFADSLFEISEQMTTDFDKALRHIDAPLVLTAGFLGGRLDHTLAALTVLARLPERPCIMLDDGAVALVPPQLALDVPAGLPVSLYPLAPVQVESSGLRWPTDGLELAPTGLVGTSNAAEGPVELRPKSPCCLVWVPIEALDALMAGLLAAPRWPSNSEC